MTKKGKNGKEDVVQVCRFSTNWIIERAVGWMIILLIADEHAIFYVDDIKRRKKTNTAQKT